MLCPVCGKDREPSVQLNPVKGENRILRVCPCGHVHGTALDGKGQQAVGVGTPGHWSNPGGPDNTWVPDAPKPPPAPSDDVDAAGAPEGAAPEDAPAAAGAPERAAPARAVSRGAAAGASQRSTGDLMKEHRTRLAELDRLVPQLTAERDMLRRVIRAADKAKAPRKKSNVVPMPKAAAQ